MNNPPSPSSDETEVEAPLIKAKGGKKMLILASAVVVLLLAAGCGLWFSGIIPRMLHGKKDASATAIAAALAKENAPPVYVDIPEIITNLNAGPRKTAFVKIKIRIELASADDQKLVNDAMPRIEDLFQTYLRETRPEELHGSIGSYRLREEFISRISIAASPVHVRDVLFTEMFTQ
jgi:flagellar FliL protein